MQKKELTPITPVALSGRTIHEITADIFVNFRNAKASIAQIGRDLNEAKQLLNHGDWLPYLEGLQISVSTAENYMRYAAAVPEDERLAALPYSAAIALLALPDDQRQRVQENDLDGKSAAEISRKSPFLTDRAFLISSQPCTGFLSLRAVRAAAA